MQYKHFTKFYFIPWIFQSNQVSPYILFLFIKQSFLKHFYLFKKIIIKSLYDCSYTIRKLKKKNKIFHWRVNIIPSAIYIIDKFNNENILNKFLLEICYPSLFSSIIGNVNGNVGRILVPENKIHRPVSINNSIHK